MTARHSTGVTEPAPFLDDDLLANLATTAGDIVLGNAKDLLIGRGYEHTSQAKDGAAMVASEPMQRLRAAWVDEAMRWDPTQTEELTHWHEESVRLERERDEARAGRAAWFEVTLELQAEVQRLRAAVLDLPDVGPVTRGSSGFLRLDGANWDEDSADDYRRLAACYLALAAFLDEEAEERAAADTTTDDEVAVAPDLAFDNDEDLDPLEVADADRVAAELRSVAEVLDDHQDLEWMVQARMAIEALDAHRARTHGEDA